jgi:hypothetical protein
MKNTILDMPFHEALTIMEEWVKEEHGGKLKLEDPRDCPVQKWIEYNNKGCGKDMVAGITTCPICGGYVCPACSNHLCTPLSRVTGYVAAVNGWNASKRQELEDRVKTQI